MRNILFFSLIFVNTTSCGELSETICQLTWMINQIMTSIGTIVLLASAYVNINNIHLFAYLNVCINSAIKSVFFLGPGAFYRRSPNSLSISI